MATLRSSPRDLSLKENRRHSRLLQQCHRSPSRSWVHSPDWCFQDEVARGADCSNPIGCSFSCRAPNRVAFNSVPITLTVGARKIDAHVFIPADGTTRKGVPLIRNRFSVPAGTCPRGPA
jgi:hypothetical protein